MEQTAYLDICRCDKRREHQDHAGEYLADHHGEGLVEVCCIT
jgi:hypothetical protein